MTQRLRALTQAAAMPKWRLFDIAGIRVCMHPLMALMAVASAMMGQGAMTCAMSLSLIFHECCHVVMARALRVRVEEIELMPLGGVARIDGLYRLRAGQLTLIALAGPVGSLVMAMGAVALCDWGILSAQVAADIAGASLMLTAFNLLPALPLDGGRVLCALLTRFVTQDRAVRAGVWAGRCLAALLLAVAGYGALHGVINVTLPMAALYILAMAQKEMELSGASSLLSLIARRTELMEERALPINWLAASGDTPLSDIAPLLRARRVNMLAVFDADMHLAGVVEESAMLDALLGERGERGACTLLDGRGQRFREQAHRNPIANPQNTKKWANLAQET